MLEARYFQERYSGQPIYIHGSCTADAGVGSVMIKGMWSWAGDQSSTLVGRDLQESEGQPPQIVIICRYSWHRGTQKMSKSWELHWSCGAGVGAVCKGCRFGWVMRTGSG